MTRAEHIKQDTQRFRKEPNMELFMGTFIAHVGVDTMACLAGHKIYIDGSQSDLDQTSPRWWGFAATAWELTPGEVRTLFFTVAWPSSLRTKYTNARNNNERWDVVDEVVDLLITDEEIS